MHSQATMSAEQPSTNVQPRPDALPDEHAPRIEAARLDTLAQLSASIAHDLRNPLGVIRNAVYLLRRRLTKLGESTDLLNMIEAEVASADGIIAHLMEISSGNVPQPAAVDLGVLAREVAERTETSGRVRWRYDLASPPFVVWSDPAQLRQVLQNVFRNSVEAMRGAGVVTVTARHEDPVDVVLITDSGPGIAAAIRARLFEPLVTSKKTGTGLGLAICRRILERHRGSIRAEYVPGEGAAFRITLPQRPADPTGV